MYICWLFLSLPGLLTAKIFTYNQLFEEMFSNQSIAIDLPNDMIPLRYLFDLSTFDFDKSLGNSYRVQKLQNKSPNQLLCIGFQKVILNSVYIESFKVFEYQIAKGSSQFISYKQQMQYYNNGSIYFVMVNHDLSNSFIMMFRNLDSSIIDPELYLFKDSFTQNIQEQYSFKEYTSIYIDLNTQGTYQFTLAQPSILKSNAFLVVLSYQMYQHVETKIQCSQECSMALAVNALINRQNLKTLQANVVFQQIQYIDLRNQYIQFYFQQSNLKLNNIVVNLQFTVKKIKLLDFPQLMECSFLPGCYINLLMYLPQETQVEYLSLPRFNKSLQVTINLGPKPQFILQKAFIFGNQDILISQFLIEITSSPVYCKIFQNNSINIEPPFMITSQTSYINLNYTLQNSWLSILFFTFKETAQINLTLYMNPQYPSHQYPLKSICSGGNIVELDCTKFCQVLDNNRNYKMVAQDQYSYFCFVQKMDQKLTLFINGSQNSSFGLSISQVGYSYRSMINKTVPFLFSGAFNEEVWIMIIPYDLILMNAYTDEKSVATPFAYITSLSYESQILQRLENFNLNCFEPENGKYLRYAANEDPCQFICMAQQSTKFLAVINESNEGWYFLACFTASNHNQSYYFFANNQTNLYCQQDQILVFKSNLNISFGIFDNDTYVQYTEESVTESSFQLGCQNQQVFLNTSQNLFYLLYSQRQQLSIQESNQTSNSASASNKSTISSDEASNSTPSSESKSTQSQISTPDPISATIPNKFCQNDYQPKINTINLGTEEYQVGLDAKQEGRVAYNFLPCFLKKLKTFVDLSFSFNRIRNLQLGNLLYTGQKSINLKCISKKQLQTGIKMNLQQTTFVKVFVSQNTRCGQIYIDRNSKSSTLQPQYTYYIYVDKELIQDSGSFEMNIKSSSRSQYIYLEGPQMAQGKGDVTLKAIPKTYLGSKYLKLKVTKSSRATIKLSGKKN